MQVEVYKEIYNQADSIKLTEDLGEEEKAKIQNYFKEGVDEKIVEELSSDELKKELSHLKE